MTRPSYFTQCGLPGIELVPFGMHACHFHTGPEQLAEILAPYFLAGLHHNERCLWITAPPLPASKAVEILSAAWPGVDEAMRTGALRVIDSDQWYGGAAAGDGLDVVQLWLDEEERALANGHAGLRLAGDISGLTPGSWPRFIAHERAVSARFNGRRIVALCSYMFDQGDERKRREVIRAHHCVLERGEFAWQVLPAAEGARAGAAPAAAIYTFDCRQANDASICLEAHELNSDDDAMARARKLLADHRTCWKIEVFDGDRLVGAMEREPRGPRDSERERSRSLGDRRASPADRAGPQGGL